MKALSFILAAALPTAAAAQTEPWEPPTLTTTRFDEDWSRLADPAARSGHWTERFKYVAIAADAWVTTGIELRLRNENSRGNQWGDAPDDGFVWLRAMPYADLHIGQVRAFLQPVAAYAIGVAPGPGPIDQTRTDLLQAFAEATLPVGDQAQASLRVGRQMLPLGSERLVGTRYGPNVQLAFDGARGILHLHGATISLIAVRPVQPGADSFDDHRSRTKSLWGSYVTLPGLDLYYLGYRNTVAHFGGRNGRELRHSLGARWFGRRGKLHWNMEAVYQFGRFADGPISAWTLATEVGRRFPDLPLKPDATMRFSLISGDGNPADHRLGTFNALFPKGKYFGELSPIGPANIISANPRVAAVLGQGWSASLAGMAYWRQSRADGVYDVPGTLIRPAGSSQALFIGKQVEASLAWQVSAELELSGWVALFEPGAFIRETGLARPIRMTGIEVNFRF
ncbi:alginate export family protein [Sandarakinorhabdus oryzae]|uniref:alginate export family protein n=1 Tax=Sandarakinorhabdus oryzae TaxID=2675220 RepID=UPI0012E17E30|nr:alginate export family protein [Sandarakinorhabdus oryzae]